ncbi:unnamed protein product [Cercopithifilaria johnstoni]|uniref:Uncharacterized protein n=1 Tax=Cercopithifilaria johnstoni TaxID=2874296 RepID=A0A8J2QBB0_9BILA|nr:unnamed protein product [Cercopithifilaria johnstoni]
MRRSAAAMMWHGVISRAGRSVSSILYWYWTLRLMTAWRTLNETIQNLILIVIDSIGAALAFTAWEYSEGGRRIQDEIITMLHYIAHHCGCAIVTTNHFVYWRGDPSPSLGKRWIKAVDFRYLLWKLSASNYYMQRINPKCHKVVNDRVFYKISNKGIDSITDVVHTQDMEAVITQNWNTIHQIYAHNNIH